MDLEVIVLAAGKGSRMQSTTPKVLHHIGGRPMLSRVLDMASGLHPKKIHVVHGCGGAQIKEAMSSYAINWVAQQELLGTGHAVKQCLPSLSRNSKALVLFGDGPLLTLNTLNDLLSIAEASPLSLLTAYFDNPFGLGRIVRDSDSICAIVEEKDASETQKIIKEIFSGILCADVAYLEKWLPNLNNSNAQSEYYLTDIVALAVEEGLTITSHTANDPAEVQGVNDLYQLSIAERVFQKRLAKTLMQQGVTLFDDHSLNVRGTLTCGSGVTIDVNNVFEGKVILEDDVIIHPNCVIKNSKIHKGAVIHPFSWIEDAEIGEECQIGPYSRLRPGTQLGAHCKIGNFVEMKKAVLDEGSKVSHLSYIGDATLGKAVNIGAGTITCNYDGVRKHKTSIGDGAFIGSGTQLVAPIHVGTNATIGAGSTLRKNAPSEKLTLSGGQQKTLEGWQRPD